MGEFWPNKESSTVTNSATIVFAYRWILRMASVVCVQSKYACPVSHPTS